MKILNENNDNKYAKAIRAVENCMIKNEVTITDMGSFTSVQIYDKEYRSTSSQWPRMFEDDKLEIE